MSRNDPELLTQRGEAWPLTYSRGTYTIYLFRSQTPLKDAPTRHSTPFTRLSPFGVCNAKKDCVTSRVFCVTTAWPHLVPHWESGNEIVPHNFEPAVLDFKKICSEVELFCAQTRGSVETNMALFGTFLRAPSKVSSFTLCDNRRLDPYLICTSPS